MTAQGPEPWSPVAANHRRACIKTGQKKLPAILGGRRRSLKTWGSISGHAHIGEDYPTLPELPQPQVQAWWGETDMDNHYIHSLTRTCTNIQLAGLPPNTNHPSGPIGPHRAAQSVCPGGEAIADTCFCLVSARCVCPLPRLLILVCGCVARLWLAPST